MRPKNRVQEIAEFLVLSMPYVFCAWAYSLAGTNASMWNALGLLVCAVIVVGLLDFLGQTLVWYLFHRRETVEQMVAHFRHYNYPVRKELVGFGLYLPRLIEGRYKSEVDAESWSRLKEAAQRIQNELDLNRHFGNVHRMRLDSAVEDAFNVYSPLELAELDSSGRPLSLTEKQQLQARLQKRPMPSLH